MSRATVIAPFPPRIYAELAAYEAVATGMSHEHIPSKEVLLCLDRRHNYLRQRASEFSVEMQGGFTPRQARRIRHKESKAGLR
jgi:hypothetical protein